MNPKPSTCSPCPLFKSSRGFTYPEGGNRIKLLILGEASGENEANEGLPFRPYAQAGSILERTLLGMKMSREDVVITNVVRCQPPGNILDGAEYKSEAIGHCKQYLDKVIDKYKPKAILALGGIALETLTGLTGKKKNISSLRGYVQWADRYSLPLVATYHPAFISRGKKNLLGVMYSDILKAIKLAKGELINDKDYYLDPIKSYPNQYNLSPSRRDISDLHSWFISHPGNAIGFDIETEESSELAGEDDIESFTTRITQVQVSKAKGHALVMTNDYSGFMQDVQGFLALPNVKLSWNGWRFDQVVLAANGVRISEPHYDLMTMFHHWNPDIPAGLQYAAGLFGFTHPWKHLAGENLAFYGASDVDVLHWIYEPLVYLMRKEGILGW